MMNTGQRLGEWVRKEGRVDEGKLIKMDLLRNIFLQYRWDIFVQYCFYGKRRLLCQRLVEQEWVKNDGITEKERVYRKNVK